MNLKRRFISILICITLVISFTTTISFAETANYGEELANSPTKKKTITFVDVDESHWAAKYISEMVNRKVVSGYPDGKFRPDKTISRAEFAKILIAITGLKAQKVSKSSFSDITPNDWYSPFVETARNYLTGYKHANGEIVYKPNDIALREDVCVALVRIKGYDTSLSDVSILEAMFTDFDSISDSAKTYVAIAVENNLISGFPDETFRGQKSLTRAEACALLWKAYTHGSKNKVDSKEEKIVLTDDNTSTSEVAPTPTVKKNTKDNPTVEKSRLNPTIESTPEPTKEITNESIIEPAEATPTPTPIVKKSKKMTVETLFGGNGLGIKDGKGSEAQVGYLTSFVLDKDDNIYTLENAAGYYTYNLDASKTFYDTQVVRKFTKSLGSVSTIVENKSLISTITSSVYYNIKTGSYEKTPKRFQYSNYSGYKLISDKVNDKVFMSGEYRDDGIIFNTSYAKSVLFQIYPNVVESVTDMTYKSGDYVLSSVVNSERCAFTQDNGAIIYSYGGSFFKVKPDGGNVSEYTSKPKSFSGYIEAFVSDGQLYVLNMEDYTFGKRVLYSYNFATKEWVTINSFDIEFDAITSYNNNFYGTKDNKIYKIDSEGFQTLFLDSSNLKLNDDLPMSMGEFTFDSQGNIIFYDTQCQAVRKINLSSEDLESIKVE